MEHPAVRLQMSGALARQAYAHTAIGVGLHMVRGMIGAMKTILLVDDTALCREAIAAVLRREGYSVVTADDGRAALEALKHCRADLLVLDHIMPNMDGLAFLQEARRHTATAHTPAIFLTGTETRDAILAAGRLHVHSYVLKSRFTVDVLLQRIRDALNPLSSNATAPSPTTAPVTPTTKTSATKPSPSAASSPTTSDLPRLLGRAETVERLERFTAPKTLSGVVAEVMAVSSGTRGNVGELVSILKQDALISTRVLQLANSSAFAPATPIANITDAVRTIGLKHVRNIAATVGIFQTLPATAADGFDLVRCWQHLVAVASIMDWIVPEIDANSGGISHMVGLCHDLPDMILRQCFTDEYAKAVEMAASSGEPLPHVQSAIFGMLSHELATLVLSRLGLPASIVAPIRAHFERHRPGATCAAGTSAAGADGLAEALRLADAFANGMLLASSPDSPIMPLLKTECRKVLGAITPPANNVTDLRCQILASTAVLAQLADDDEARLNRPLLAPTETKIWYARHSAFSSFDPVAVALEMLAKPVIHDRLPMHKSEFEDLGGIVIAAPRLGVEPMSSQQVQEMRCACDNAAIPILYLSPSGYDPILAAIANLEVAPLPVALDHLAKFVARCPAGAQLV